MFSIQYERIILSVKLIRQLSLRMSECTCYKIREKYIIIRLKCWSNNLKILTLTDIICKLLRSLIKNVISNKNKSNIIILKSTKFILNSILQTNFLKTFVTQLKLIDLMKLNVFFLFQHESSSTKNHNEWKRYKCE